MTSTALEGASRTVDLVVGGMTCTSCAGRIEKKLNRLDGVTASVNYATETARVKFPSTVGISDLVSTVESTGYTARPADAAAPEATPLRARLTVSAVLTVPVLILAMIPAAQFDGWQWLALALATPVVLWGGWPFHRAAWLNLRHRAATMDTLISMGSLAAYGWSLYAMVFGDAGTIGMRTRFELTAGSSGNEMYFEVSAAVIVFLLAGRTLEVRAKRNSGAALRAL